jgi:hypothetical protein
MQLTSMFHVYLPLLVRSDIHLALPAADHSSRRVACYALLRHQHRSKNILSIKFCTLRLVDVCRGLWKGRDGLDHWYSTFFVRVPPYIISLQLCTPKAVGA